MEKIVRCTWAEKGDEAYLKYHDEEWGVPVYDDQTHFEFLVLETAQAGLSWLTVLRKRKGYRKAFASFDVKKVAEFTNDDIENLVRNPEIIRNRAKINAAVTNARKFIEIQKEFGSFSNYIWNFVNNSPIKNNWKNSSEVPATSPESDALSTDLKARGFKFVGSTVIYAHMQATGLINDHQEDCFRYDCQ